MPRTFLNSILNRPSQSYAPPMPPDPTTSPQQSTPSNTAHWLTPTDLPNAPRQPTSLRQQNGKASRRTDSISSTAPPSSIGAGARSRSRFGMRKKKSRPSIDGSTFDNDGMSSVYAESNATNATQTKKRWWDTSSLRGFGKSSRSRAGSVAGDSIFSEPPDRPRPQVGSMVGVGSKANPSPRATRSDYGGAAPSSPARPPLPENGAAMIRSMSGATAKAGSGVAPLGQAQPSLTMNGPKRSKTDLRSAASSPPPASVTRRSSAIVRRDSGSDWNSFTQSMSNRDIAKNWTRNPPSKASVESAGPERRHSVVDRVRRELEQDAQAEQVSRDPGVLHGDLLARAASAVVGPPQSESSQDQNFSHLPSTIRPGSIIAPSSQNTNAADEHPAIDGHPAPVQHDAVQPTLPSATHQSQSHTSPEATAAVAPAQQQQQSPSADERKQADVETSEEEETSSEEEDEDSREHPTLDVVAEEDEDASSNGGHEMRAGPRFSYIPRKQSRHSAFDSAIGRMSFASPSSPTSPQLKPLEEPNQPASLLHNATNSTPAIAINGGDKETLKRAESPVSPPVPPKSLPPVAIDATPVVSEEPASPRQASKQTQSRPELQAVTQDLKLQRNESFSSGLDSPSAYASAAEDGTDGTEVKNRSSESASSSSESASEDETDEESGKDGEIGEVARPESPRGVKFEGEQESSDEEDSGSSDVDEDDDAVAARGKAKGKAKALSQDGDTTETGSLASEATTTRTARNGSIKSSRPGSMQRRLSDISLGNSFAFSHFMGSKMSGRSSSRRIKLADDASDSSGEASEEDEELKKMALAEQDRLRNMSVGDDFFGPSLNDVLAQFDKMDFTLPDDEAMKAIAAKAQADGTSHEDSVKAQKEAQNIVSEVRRRRAAGASDNDGKTLQSEAGGLAASFAALWLLNQSGDDNASARNSEKQPNNQTHQRTPSKTSHDSPASPSTITAALPASSRPGPVGPMPRSSSIMNRPRHKVEKPREMGGIAISKGKLAADAPSAPQDERSTLPSLSSFPSLSLSSPPVSPKKASLDLGDQKRSKDKPPPSKSALKAKSIRHSKSLADTLFSFAPKKNTSPASPEKKPKRIRSNSLIGRASSRETNDSGQQAQRADEPRKSSETTRSALGLTKKSKKTKAERNEQPAVAAAPVSPPTRVGDSGSLSSADRSPIKEAGQPSFHAREMSNDSVLTDGEAQMPSERYVTAQDVAALAAGTAQPRQMTQVHAHQRQESSATSASEQTTTSMANGTEDGRGDADSLQSSHVESTRNSQDASSTVDPELESSRNRVDADLTAPSTNEWSPLGGDSASSSEQEPTPGGKLLDLPPPPDFNNATSSDMPSPGEDRTPMATTSTQPTFGMAVIPPTPPATDVKSKIYVAPAEQKTPTAEMPSPFAGTVADRPGLSRSTSSSSKKTETKRGSVRKSGVSSTDSHGLVLPNGLTATTVASSNSIKRKKSKKDAHNRASAEMSRQAAAPPLPVSASAVIASAHAAAAAGTDSPPRPTLPPKDEPSRRYSTLSSGYGGAVAPPANGLSASSLASLSPPSTAPSSTGTPERDISPARSVSGASSSVTSSSASNTSGRGGADSVDGFSRSQHKARVRTQSTGPSRRPAVMTAISEWDHSPVSGYASPVSQPSPVSAPRYESFTPSSVARSSSSVMSGPSPEVVRNAPMGAPTDAYLQPPVPRSRLTLEERQRQQFEAQLDAAGYSRSEGGHGAAAVSLSRQNSMNGMARSVDGHGGFAPPSRPASVISSFSAVSIPQSVSTLPSVPMSSYRPAKDPVKAAGSSSIDDRLYQRSTMATISVSTGAFAKTVKGSSRRKSSLDSTAPPSDGVARRSTEHVPEHLQDELGLTQMSLTAHTPPPRKVGSRQALVQVIAVAIDEMDRMLLRDKIRSGDAYGWVPGRSFCGRVMEVGWEVKKVRKGDMVFGLQTNRRCGALAEFMTIDEENMAKAPEDCLTVEQIAALPSTGVLALQLVRNYCSSLPRGARILILNAHDGIGLLSMQECAELGLVMVAQCPPSVSDGVAVCEANGAHEVVVGEPLWAMNTLHESSFDLVVDTIGGRRMYDAARRILASNGQFVTCFGDEHSSANPNFKSHMRSLRRTFFKKDKKNIGYEWIGLENAEDVKECLEAVRNAAERGDICPRLSSVLPFADAPRAFDPVIRGVEEAPGAVVVRVS